MKDKIVKEWFKKAEQEIETAKLLFDSEWHYDIILFHIHQAVEKYLKGYPIHHGWKLKKIHDIEMPLTDAIKFDATSQEFLDFGRKITGFYYGDRYPAGIMGISKEEVDYSIENAEKTIEKVKNIKLRRR